MRDPATYAVAVGVILVVASVTFPAWSLFGYSVSVTEVDAPPDDAARVDGEQLRTEQTHVAVVAFEDLDSESRSLVRSALQGDGRVTVYGAWYSHQSTNGELPAIVENAWLDSYELGGYVEDGDRYYEVSAGVHSEPLIFPMVIGAGVIVGLVVAGVGGLVRHRGGPAAVAYVVTAVGFALLVGLARFGNLHGHVVG